MDSFSNIGNPSPAGSDINNPEFNKEGKNVTRAISSANQALGIAKRLELDDGTRDARRSLVMRAFNGAAPYRDGDLKNAGQAWAFNVSFGFLEGVVGRASAPFIKFGANVNKIAAIEGTLDKNKMDVVREEFVNAVKAWKRWLKTYSRLVQELTLNGWAVFMWPEDYNPFPTFAPQSDFWVPEGSANHPADLELFVWRKNYKIHELFDFIRDPEAASQIGWNVENVRKALEGAKAKILGDNAPRNWEQLEKALRDGAMYATVMTQKDIKCFNVFVKEMDGGVTHWIVVDQPGNSETELFKRDNKFASFEDFLTYFDLEAGDGKWTGSKGVGQKGFNTHRANDKLNNEILNQAFMSGMVPLTVKDEADQEDLQLTVWGRFCCLPPGVEVTGQPIPAISSEMFQSVALLQNTSEQRLGDVVPNADNFTGGKKTATQSSIDASRQAVITDSNLIRFNDPFGMTVQIILKRLLMPQSPDPYAKAFQAKLKERGLTDQDLVMISGAKAFGEITESMGKVDEGIMVLSQEYRGDPDFDQLALKFKRAQSLVGTDIAKEIVIGQDDKTLQIESSRQQTEEFNSILSGLDIPVSPRDNHAVELQTLVELMKNSLGKVPPQVMDLAGKHAAQHLQFLKSDKSNPQQTAELEAALSEIGAAVDQMQQQQNATRSIPQAIP
jgi:hypothetical protein